MQNGTFGDALAALKEGKKVARAHWNANHVLDMVPADEVTLPFISMTVGSEAADLQGKRVPWVASQTDLFAEDWFEITE